MKVRHLIRLIHTKVTPDTPVSRVWQLLSKRNITLLSVVDTSGQLRGVIGEDDLLYLLVPDYRDFFSEFSLEAPKLSDVVEKFEKEITLTASDVMNRSIITARPDDEIFKALSRMMIYKVRVLPVVDENSKYFGMIVEDDIMQQLFKMHRRLAKRKK